MSGVSGHVVIMPPAPSQGSLVSNRRSEKGLLTGASRSKVAMRTELSCLPSCAS